MKAHNNMYLYSTLRIIIVKRYQHRLISAQFIKKPDYTAFIKS